ncbi:unnamed protein product, partial [Rotaria sordida]
MITASYNSKDDYDYKIRDLYTSNLCYFSEFNASIPLKFVYIPVHDIGQSYVEQALVAFTFQSFISVDEQKRNVDPNFPTVGSFVKDFNTIDTLTGFKWLENISHQLLNDKKYVLFGFEEV